MAWYHNSYKGLPAGKGVEFSGIKIGFLAALVGALAQAAFAQDTLATWLYNTPITLNTSPTGGNVTTTQTNFPILIRLTSANAASVFAAAQSTGADLRFSRSATDTAQFPYQISKYNQAAQTAYIWVKPDTVGGSNASQSIQMWWGKGAAAARSNGPAVFAPANGFVAVWHLDSAGVGAGGKPTFNDATGNGYMDTGTATLIDSPSVILDSCYAFNKWLLPSTAGGIGDSIYINSLLGSPGNGGGGAVTISAWVKPDSMDQVGKKVTLASIGNDFSVEIQGGGNVNDTLHCAYHASAGWNNGTGNQPLGPIGAIHPPMWKHVAWVVKPSQDTNAVYVNGALGQALLCTNAIAYASGTSLGPQMVLGADEGNTGRTAFFGEMCEVRVENVGRPADWLRLSFENEQQNDSVTSLSANVPGTPVLSTPSNGTVNASLMPNLSWGSVGAATSYSVLVSTSSAFGATVFGQTGIITASVTPSVLANTTTYYWQVRATNVTLTSPWSSVWSFTTTALLLPAAPALSSPTNAASNQPLNLTLSWGAVLVATSYAVQVSTSASFGTTVFGQSGLTAPSSRAGGLANGTTYYWRAGSVNLAGSTWSGVWSFGTIPATAVVPAGGSTALKTDFVIRGEALSYSLASPGEVEITFRDLLGRTALQVKRTQASGNYAMDLRDCALASGRYIVRFRAAGIDRSVPAVVAR